MRLHVGSGTVYLAPNWINIDLPGPHTFLAQDRPDLVDRYLAADEDYYARHKDKTLGSMSKGPLEQECVCDRYGSFDFLPCGDGEADEILARHVFEHLSLREARAALRESSRVLRHYGLLRLDVPDHEQSLQLLMSTQNQFYLRHVLGPRRNEFGYHLVGYDRKRLTALVESCGYSLVAEEPNIHLYPAFCLRFVKE